MVNRVETEVFASISKAPEASSDHRFEVIGNLGCEKFQDTEPMDDESIALDSSLLETSFEKLYNDTEIVDCGDEETLNLEFEEVVDDSEDEDGNVAPVETAETCLPELSVKAVDILLESDGSNDNEYQRGLSFVESQEPGESTQANALGFVDQFLMDKDLNLSPVGLPETSWRMKSPPFSGAKGRQCLAKRIKTSSPTKKMSVFDWDSDQCDVSDPQNLPVAERKEDDDHRVKKGSMDPCENIKLSTHPTHRLMLSSSARHQQTSGLSQDIMFTSDMNIQVQDKASEEQPRYEEDLIDVGINTQIAAEAMSALLFAPCTKEEAPESERRDQVSNLSVRNNDTIEGRPERDNRSGPLSYAIKKRNHGKRKFTINERITNVSAMTCLLDLCEWRHPRAKRSRLTQRHHISPRKCWGAGSAKDISETNTLSSRLRVSLSGTRQASSCQSGINDLDVADHASPRKLYGRSHESSCNKDLPKSFLRKEITRLGGSEKIGDLMWKDLRRRRNLAHVRVLFSQNLDDETIKQQKKIMVRLGISPASSSADSTHFIADRFSRTRNMLEAIALGKPVVTPLWLESCGQTRCLIDEKSYILKDSKKEKNGFCIRTSLSRAKQHPLLKGLKVCITPNIKPDRGMIAHLVKLTQGQVVEISEIIAAEDRNFLEDLLILSCEDDRDFCLPFTNQGAVIYTSELLLNGIVIQKLEYDRHRLF